MQIKTIAAVIASTALVTGANAALIDFSQNGQFGALVSDNGAGSNVATASVDGTFVTLTSSGSRGGNVINPDNNTALGNNNFGLGVDSAGGDNGGEIENDPAVVGSGGSYTEMLRFDFTDAMMNPIDVTLNSFTLFNGDDGETLTLTVGGDTSSFSALNDTVATNFSVDGGSVVLGVGEGESYRIRTLDFTVNAIPEPTSIASLLGMGLLGLRRRR